MNQTTAFRRTAAILWAVALGLSLLFALSLLLPPTSTIAQLAAPEAPLIAAAKTGALPLKHAPPTVPTTLPQGKSQGHIHPPDFVLQALRENTSQAPAGPDTRIWKWNPPGYARPGGVINYGIWYDNSGGSIAENVSLVDTLPLSTTYAGDNSGFTPEIGANGVITWHVGHLNPGEGRLFVLTLNVEADVVPGTTLAENCIAISTTTSGDPNPDNNQACSGPVEIWEDEVEMHVDKWPNPGDPTPGEEFIYDMQVCNNRGATAGPLVLTDTLPAYTSLVSWHHDSPWAVGWQEVAAPAGTFALMTPGFPGSFCDTIHLRLLLDAAAPQNMTLSNYVQLAIADDVYLENNARLNRDARVSPPRYDLRLDKNMHAGVLVPGGGINYFIWYGNQGNAAAHVWVTETVPAGLTFEYAHWGGGQPGENEPLPDPIIVGDQLVWDLGELPVNGSRWFHVQMSVAGTLEPGDSIMNCATVGTDHVENTPENNTGCTTVILNGPGPNLRVIKEHWWNGDEQLGYRIHFWNVGDEEVSPFWITDTLPTDTAWDGWWNLNWDWERLEDQSLSSDVLVWKFYSINPGEYGQLEFNANLDEPGMPLRWYTNTVEITLREDDADPADNVYEDVAFSGGEVEWVDFDIYRTHVWGCAPRTPITVTTAQAQLVFWDACWNENNFPDTFDPGDVITVTAGAGLHPVVIHVPDPFTGYIASDANEVWGQIDALDHEPVHINLWGLPQQWVQTDANGHYSATFDEIPRGARGDVEYWTEIDYAWVGFHHRLVNPDLVLNVNYDHDWVEGEYESGHTVWITVTDALGHIKAVAELPTGAVPWWGGQTGFSTNWDDSWQPQRPDIAPGDWVHGATETGHTATVHIGQITGVLDVDTDSITGAVDAAWLLPGPVEVECHTWGAPGGAPNKFDTVTPDGVDPYTCAWDPHTEWDVQPGQDLAVAYREPEGHTIFAVFRDPAPRLRIEKWLDGAGIGEGGNAVFHVQYHNQGDAPAEDVVITDTLQGMTYITDTSGFPITGGGNQVVIQVGTVAPGERSHIFIFAEITAAAGERVTNTVEIATSNPFDQGDVWDKRNEWSDNVQPNDTHLNVGKWAWTGDPAAGYDVVFAVNTCNFGATASAEVVLTDTLHPSMTLQTWWGQYPGWSEVSRSAHELVVSRPTIPGYWCQELYLRATVDAAAWPGLELWNHAAIYAANDLSTGDDEAWWWGNVNEARLNLLLDKWWNWGQLVPGGELRYNINYNNTGNIPVGTFRITDTLPVSTTFLGAWQGDIYGDQHPVIPLLVTDEMVVWEFDGLDNGFAYGFEVALRVDRNATPGTLLRNVAEITCFPGEEDCKDNGAAWEETLFAHGPNLRVTKWGDWHGDRPGHAWYHFRVENVGDEAIAQAVITDTYPLLMAMEGGVDTDWGRVAGYAENPAEHWFAFLLENVHPGYRLDFHFNTTMAEPVAPGLALTNTVSVASVAGDTNPADDRADFPLFTGPMLWVQKGITGEPQPGELLTFTLTFGNEQVGHAQWWTMQGHAILTDTLPAGFEYISAQQHWCGGPDEWCERDPDRWEGEQAIWDLWPLHPQEWNEIRVTVRVPDTATGLDTFTNAVAIGSSAPDLDAEWDYSDNTAAIAFEITLPYFEVSKVYTSSRVAGTPITYTLTVTNSGNADGTAVVLSDPFPAGFTYTASDGALVGDTVQWTFATLAKLGGVGHGWFSGVLPCATGAFVNANYAVISSAEGVTSAVGAPVSLQVLAPNLVADFSASATSVVQGTPIVFTDTSTTNGAAIVSWAWNFGDGSTGTAQHPTHTYTTPGMYIVTLTVTDACGFTASKMLTLSISLACTPLTSVDFTYLPAKPLVGAPVTFTVAYAPYNATMPVNVTWTFGDGSTTTTTNASVTHTYATAGPKTVRVVAVNTCTPGGVQRERSLTIEPRKVYLPLVLRNHP